MIDASETSIAVTAAVERYRADGYEIVFHPSRSLLPEPVRSFEPDFIARQGDENIAVEVKSRAALKNDKELRRYAELFRTLPGWRLDLVVVPDEVAPPPQPKWLTRESLRKRLESADALANEHGDLGGAIVLLWTTLESTLRDKADDNGRLPIVSGARLVKQALSLGLISDAEWEELDRLADVRNQVAHGEAPGRITKTSYKSARSIASRLIETDS